MLDPEKSYICYSEKIVAVLHSAGIDGGIGIEPRPTIVRECGHSLHDTISFGAE